MAYSTKPKAPTAPKPADSGVRNALPMEWTITEFAKALNVPRHKIARRCKVGRIPTTRTGAGEGKGATRVILTSELQRVCPEYYNALLFAARITMLDDDDDEYRYDEGDDEP